MPRWVKSRLGLWVAGSYVALAATAFSVHLTSTYTNVANSGESGILLIPFALPWISWIDWMSPGFFRSAIWENPFLAGWWLLVGTNALLLYVVCGGVRWRGRRDG
jgi:hypothetical protein